ncbi:MAG: response regulator transcription factor [Bacteroidia bacterium]
MRITKILLVDDEPDALDFLSYNFKNAGYEVFTALDGRSAIQIAKEVLPDIIILDVMMPEMDGIETCKELRGLPETKNTIIVFFTARSEDYSQIAGLDAGADGYIWKPITPRLLMSRVKAILRRNINSDNPVDEVVDNGGRLKIDQENYTVTLGKEIFELPKKEFELLLFLYNNQGKVLSRENILYKVWGVDTETKDRSVDVLILKLREKLGEASIRTVKGVGYLFEL